MSTVCVEWSDRLAELAARHRVAFVDAPVSGSSQPAQNGQLVILASGAGAAQARLEPVFEILGRQTLWLQRIGQGSRLKLALNNWLAILVEGMAETLTLASALGLDPCLFLTTIAGGPLSWTYALDKATAMIEHNFTPGFPLRHATKDAALAADAAHDHGIPLPLTDALLSRWQQAIASGHGHDDVASAITASATTDSATTDSAITVLSTEQPRRRRSLGRKTNSVRQAASSPGSTSPPGDSGTWWVRRWAARATPALPRPR
jgi:3-hydroxyisobutyrate dehydrogenase